LPEAVANRIAAGEVVERPASVVKELLENAIDAGATRIRVEVESGGKRLIRVTDDGCGMGHDDALLAFERHATSKLRNADDLLAIDTLGFRGEALPSIASVSRLVLETCARETPEGLGARGKGLANTQATSPQSLTPSPSPGTQHLEPSTSEGTRVEFAGGKLISVKPAGVPPGTTISVGDLFYSVPARRKFLKSETTELGHIASLVTHYALAHPEKQFELRTPTQVIVDAAPVTTLAERVYQLFGRAALEELLEIAPATGPFRASVTEEPLEPGEEAATLTVRGFVSRPEVQRANRNGIFIFVNRRLVRDRLILHAIHEAYRNMMPANVFPSVLLFLEMPSAEVDVNVHPAKVEVRFRHPNFVHDFARDAIRQALTQAKPIAAFPAGARTSAEPQTGVAMQSGGPWVAASAPPGAAFQPLAAASGQTGGARAGAGAAPARAVIPMPGFELSEAPQMPEAQRFAFEAGAAGFGAPAGLGAAPGDVGAGLETRPPGAEPAAEDDRAGLKTGPYSDGAAQPTSLATLKPLGQVSNSFIVAVNGEGLWIVDQHVAHERVLFEQHLRARRAGAITGQRLLEPLMTDLSPQQTVILEQIGEELSANGFDVEPMGGRSVAIQATPAGIRSADAEKLLRQILEGVEKETAGISMDSLQAKIAASTSCQAAIKVNTPLDQAKMEWLLAELAKTECPMSCPHGRPIVLRYSLREIEKAFKRI
jgi:DNA mismatch repair protein MutL